MTDCANVTMREQLPELAAGSLSTAACAAVEAHVAVCADCAAELEVLRSVRAGIRLATPAIDIAAIAAALPSAPGATRRRPVVWQAAAAILVLAVGAGSFALIDRSSDNGAPADTLVASAMPAAAEGLALTGRLEGMNDGQIRALIQELDEIEALPSVEVERVSPAIELGGAAGSGESD